MHNSDYRSPEQIPTGPVLVGRRRQHGLPDRRGELSATHEVHLSIGPRQTPLPQRPFGRDIFSYFVATGLMNDARLAPRPAAARPRDPHRLKPSRRPPQGIHLHARTTRAASRSVTFNDGTSLEIATVIWATGFGLEHSWIDAPIFDVDGAVEHQRGVARSPGLCFLGLPRQHTCGSALLGWVNDDAAHLALQMIDRTQETHA